MSRIGKLPIAIPAGVTVAQGADGVVTVKGPKGELSQKDDRGIVGKLLVLADEHTQLVVINTDIIVKHLQRQLASLIYIFKKE